MNKKVAFKKVVFLVSLIAICLSLNSCDVKSTQQDISQYGQPFDKVPDPRDVTMYQVNIRTFSAEGDLKGVTERLESIKALGVNVVYLMPIFPIGEAKSINSPYCIKSYTEVNKEFGTLDDLRALVDEAHENNMAVMLDWVANHTSYDHEWTIDKSWYLQDPEGNIMSPPDTGWSDVAQLDFSNQDMRQAMIDSMRYWIFAANVDGFRCDYSDGPPTDFWKQALDSLRRISTHKLLMMAEGRRNDNYTVGFDYNFGFSFYSNLKSIFEKNQSVKSIDDLNNSDYIGASNRQQIVRYVTNHDVNSSDGTPLDLFGGEKGSIAAFVVAAYMKGVPMIYNGQEVGTPNRLSFPFTSSKINWEINPDITAEYKKIITFRNDSEAIRRGQLTSYCSDDVCAFIKQQNDEKVLVIVNLRDKNVDHSLIPELVNTSWTDAMNGGNVKLSEVISLHPYSYLILSN